MLRNFPNPTRSDNNSDEDNKDDHLLAGDGGQQTTQLPHDLEWPFNKCHTYIDLSDVEEREWDITNWPSKWKRLELLNRGIYNGQWADKELKRGQDDWYLCRSISCYLDLSDILRGKLWDIYRPLDMRKFSKYEPNSSTGASSDGHQKQHLVIFCICALLYNQNTSEGISEYYPGKEYECRDRYGVQLRSVSRLVDGELRDCHKLLQQFADEHGFSETSIRSCMEKLRQKTSQLRAN